MKLSIRVKTIIISFLLFILLLGGCSAFDQFVGGAPTGKIFTHIRVPYTRNLDNTTVTNIHANGLIIHVEEPISGYGLYTEFNSNAIGDIAKSHGLTKVYFADMEIFDVLGIWHHERLHIYGEKNEFSEKENSGKKGEENEK